MSRRPGDNKAAAQNQQTIKSLLKLEANKNCADCKKNKHPRWASWNLGIFICIRCSGIHRGMGTHISRVKSVDLDAWTDEQLQSVMRWGNGRANKYWESKLAAGHVPSDAKIENFIRTKYEAKRWVMEGPMPDPSTLAEDGGDDNVPLNVVQDRAKLDRSSSQRMSSAPLQQPQSARRPEPAAFDLIGGDDTPAPPARPSTTDTAPQATKPPPPKNQTPSQLLGGLDFLGGPPERPASASSKPSGGISRPDLKQSILSLYATAPKPQPQSADQSHNRQPSFGGLQSPGGGGGGGSTSSFGGLGDAFAGLNFGSSSNAPPKPQQSQPKPSTFSGFGQASQPIKSPPIAPQMTSPQVTSPPLSGGGFFDPGPKPPPKPAAPKAGPNPLAARKISNASDGFGDFSTAMSSEPAKPAPSNNSNGLLDFTSNPMPSQPAPQPAKTSSVFDLSTPKPASNPPQPVQASKPAVPSGFGGLNDPWGGNEWSNPAPAPGLAKPAQPMTSAPTSSSGGDFGWGSSTSTQPSTSHSAWGASSTSTSNMGSGGWGDSDAFGGGFGSTASVKPKVTPEEDFGGWSSSTGPAKPVPPPTQSSSGGTKPFAPADDPWANVWE